MATVDSSAPKPSMMSVAARQGTATMPARRVSLSSTRVLQGIWAMWMIALVLLLLPYFPGLFGGTAFLFASIPGLLGLLSATLLALPTFVTFLGIFLLSFVSTVESVIAFLFHYLPTFIVNDQLRNWFGWSNDTANLILSFWFPILAIAICGAAIIALWRVLSTLPPAIGVLGGVLVALLGVVVALASLQMIGYIFDAIYNATNWLTSLGYELQTPILLIVIVGGLILIPYLLQQAKPATVSLATKVGLRVLAVGIAVVVGVAILLLMTLIFKGLDSLFHSLLSVDLWWQIPLLALIVAVGAALLRALWLFVPGILNAAPEGSTLAQSRTGIRWLMRFSTLAVGLGVTLALLIFLSYPLRPLNDLFSNQPQWLSNLNSPFWLAVFSVFTVAALVALLWKMLGSVVEAVSLVNIALASLMSATLLFNSFDSYGMGWFNQILITVVVALLAGALFSILRWQLESVHLVLSVVAGVLAIIMAGVALVLQAPFSSHLQWFEESTWLFTLFFSVAGILLLVYLWAWIGRLPLAFHGVARFVTVLLVVLVTLETLLTLSYGLNTLWRISSTLIAWLDPGFISDGLRAWWFVVAVLLVGAALATILWNGARRMAGIALAGILIWAHVFGWEVSQIQPQTLLEKAPKMGQIVSDLAQANLAGRDEQVLEVSAQSLLGSLTPEKGRPVVISQDGAKSVLNSKRPRAPGEVIVPPKDESETFNLHVDIPTDTVVPGQQITVTGKGFRPNTAGIIRWQSTGVSASLQDLGNFTPDAQGNFTALITIPTDPDRVINLSGTPNTIAFTQRWPTGDLYFSDTFTQVRDAIIQTLFLALMATTLGVILSLPLSLLASRNLMSQNLVSKSVYVATRTTLNVARAVEVLIWALIFVPPVGIGPLAGMLAIGVHSVASLGKLYSEQIEAIDPGPIEAITATGANRLQVIRYAVIPQFIPYFISLTLYRWDVNVRFSTLVGLVGGGGIGLLLIQYINILDWHDAGTAILFIALVVIAMDYASTKIRAAVV